jgi:hypothetical protein
MTMFRLTGKLRAFMGLDEGGLSEEPPGFPFGDWYANLLGDSGRRHLLFTSSLTLYAVVVPGVDKAQLADLGGLFRQHLEATLLEDGFSAGLARALCGSGPDALGVATDDSVLGSMNDYARDLERYMQLGESNLLSVSRDLNIAPMDAIGMASAVDFLRARLSTS